MTEPANKIYYATMEEGFYEVDVKTLQVKTLYHDEAQRGEPKAGLPGYHGKGLYSGQGRLVYANNGEHGAAARRNPLVPSGVLAEWDGRQWKLVLRAQFTEVTGPGGIHGNPRPETDPIWSIGFDARSLILMLLDGGRWHRFRLPKASHSYDGAHGWNTEWPRIREIGEDDLLMTMHGMFWRFPPTFSADNTAGIAPRSTYLKVVGDFCRWKDHVVLGCDDTARNEFLNKRKAKGQIAGPQSQSNLWFVPPQRLDELGPVIGRGAVWLEDEVPAGEPSDPFLAAGFARRAVHLCTDREANITIEADVDGRGNWTPLTRLKVDGYAWRAFAPKLDAVWLRLRSDAPLAKATAWFHFAGEDQRTAQAPAKFAGLAKPGDTAVTGGLVRARGGNERTLHFAAETPEGKLGYYILDGDMKLAAEDDSESWDWMQQNVAIPSRDGVIEQDAASLIYIDDAGQRFRLPRGGVDAFDQPGPLGWARLDREVATERDLFNCHGTFFELPAENAGGFARVRPVATHNLRISDYCSYRGLLIISGVHLAAAGDNRHIIRSEDGRTGLWVGAIDDIWELGKPVGVGGPWLNTAVKAGEVSDPYLMTGYDRKTLTLAATGATTVDAEIDLTGMGLWKTWKSFELEGDRPVEYPFPREFQAYWIRFRSSHATVASAQLRYE